MAIVSMQKVAIVAHRPLKERLIEALQEEGVVQIAESDAPPLDHTEANFRIAELQFAIDTLMSVAEKATIAAARKPSDVQHVLAAASATDVRGIVDTLHRLESDDTEASGILQEMQTRLQALTPWHDLPYALDASWETSAVRCVLGTLPDAQRSMLEQRLRSDLPRTSLLVMPTHDATAHIAAHVWKEDLSAFEHLATSLGWTTVSLPALPGLPAHLMEEARVALRAAEARREQNAAERRELSRELPALLRTSLAMHWLAGKQQAREAAVETTGMVMLLGWMPKNDIDRLADRLQELSPAIAILKVKPDEGEEPPVYIRNSRFLTPFESVTTLYGLPLPSEMDPTVPLAPFFILYYALCLTDAGYGLVLATIFGIYVWKSGKTTKEAPLPWLLFFSGIVTFFVSIPFGGWFGITPDQAPDFLTKVVDGQRLFRGQIWNLSDTSGITFLQNLSLFLGLTHLFFGMFLAGMHKWVHGQRAAAFWQDFTSHLLLASILLFLAAPVEWKSTAQYVLYGMIALFVWGKGYGNRWFLRPIMGVLGSVNFAIGLLSNGLSYLRILALGLVTGAIALAVNQVAIEMGKLFPWFLNIPVVLAIAIVGHTVSIALNALGSFIHSGRLQFIEFFGQFFEGGGKPFLPFRRTEAS